MDVSSALASIQTMLVEVGEDIAIRRYEVVSGVKTTNKTDTTARARVMGYKPSQLVGGVTQGDRRVIVLVDALSSVLPVTTNDYAVVGGKQLRIKAVDDNTRRINGTLIALELTVGG